VVFCREGGGRGGVSILRTKEGRGRLKRATHENCNHRRRSNLGRQRRVYLSQKLPCFCTTPGWIKEQNYKTHTDGLWGSIGGSARSNRSRSKKQN